MYVPSHNKSRFITLSIDKQVFPSLEFIGWYTVAPFPTSIHIGIQAQFTNYTSSPLLLILQPAGLAAAGIGGKGEGNQSLPLSLYEPTVEIHERVSRNMLLQVEYKVETGEAERIAVDWSAKGGEGGGSCKSVPKPLLFLNFTQ